MLHNNSLKKATISMIYTLCNEFNQLRPGSKKYRYINKLEGKGLRHLFCIKILFDPNHFYIIEHSNLKSKTDTIVSIFLIVEILVFLGKRRPRFRQQLAPCRFLGISQY